MKLSSCDWAAEVSEPMMVTTAGEPCARPMASSAGLITLVTVPAVSVSVRVATFLPVRVPLAFTRLSSTVARRSAETSGLINSAGGAWSIHAWLSWCPMWMVWWSRDTQSSASPVLS